MRLVYARIRPDSIYELKNTYEEKIIPRLKKTPGCLYVGVIVIEPEHDIGFSMTLWESHNDLQAYENSGLYQESLNDIRPFLSDSFEQKLQLSEGLKLEYVSVPEEPQVKSYATIAEMDVQIPAEEHVCLANLRLLNIKIQPGKLEEFRSIYWNEVLPVLKSVKGCQYAFLTESLEDRNEVISITFWDSKKNMEDYEEGGFFDVLNNKVRHTYRGLYRWKMKAEEKGDSHAVTSEDIQINYYCMLTGRHFRKASISSGGTQ